MYFFSRLQLLLFFLAVLGLRLAIGAHFFQEGLTKVHSGNFTSKYFLASAKGPWADFFGRFLDDPDGAIRLCLKTENPLKASLAELNAPEISPEFSLMVWNDFGDRIKQYYQFGSPELLQTVRARMAQAQAELAKLEQDSPRTKVIENRIQSDLKLIASLQQQLAKADVILADHQEQLLEFLDTNRADLIAYFAGDQRLQGFDRDGQNRENVALQVASLREQVDTIRTDRQRKFQGWTAQVESLWNSLESQLNQLAVDRQRDKPSLSLHRPFDQPYSWQKIIDWSIPWFDTVIGALLILGLFTRFASVAAAGFLASVIATQPPWIPGTTPTMLYLIELIGCLLLFAVAAGRMGGLDYFFAKQPSRNAESATAADPSLLTHSTS